MVVSFDLKVSSSPYLGTLCVKDFEPRQLSLEQVESVRRLSRQTPLELRRNDQTMKELDRATAIHGIRRRWRHWKRRGAWTETKGKTYSTAPTHLGVNTPAVVPREAWEAARQQMLVKEKAHMRARDAYWPWNAAAAPGVPRTSAKYRPHAHWGQRHRP
jgi:hypothetical protein